MSETSPSLLQRRAFTLTELLVVIAIIAVLAALGTAGVMTAMAKAKATRIKTELDQIDSALKAYKEKFGSFPPCNLAFKDTTVSATEQARRLAQVKQHLALAFPRYNASFVEGNGKSKLENDFTMTGIDLTNIRPDQALVFWLRGFSPNRIDPILSIDGKQIANGTPTGTFIKRANAFFEFDATRLIGVPSGSPSSISYTNPAPSYFPAATKPTVDTTSTTAIFPVWQSGGAPLVYFDSSFYEFAPAGAADAQPNTFNAGTLVLFPTAGIAAPYWHDRNGNGSTYQAVDMASQETWANPDSYQLISAGSDGKYGQTGVTPPIKAHMYPTATNYDTSSALADDDNATNFTSKARIGDDRP